MATIFQFSFYNLLRNI